MPLLTDVGTYGAANGGGTVGVTIFEGQMPPTVDAGVCLSLYGGMEPDYVLGVGAIYTEKPHFQVYCRHTDFATGLALIELWYELLAQVVNQTLTATKYLRIEPIQSPFQLSPPRDSQGRWEWFCNFRTEKALG